MYCYTYVSGINCVINELLLWTEISSEHPIFIQTVAKLTNKDLPKNIIDNLNNVNKIFKDLNEETKELRNRSAFNFMNFYYVQQVKRTVYEFLRRDEYFLRVLMEVKAYGTEDKVWQTLLEHIIEEQTFMYTTFNQIINQL
ncbi:hypothetical protein CLHOM_04110 [Clostridium homopropionicum DSM 5847]|uniref:DUF2935 domain-containing protein n=1 Tax=Clostridium homopropionicum DSM 5847 TaxID=1121318 RepID=A0A0L6ZE85_9CLOT|nr:DUF2935 domain-containing protein [Clostridium homopropionicum]KOA21281.1 hypothetical protein CLHOM_04110 [Clostridium homopropionicum DSM 5847]SFG29786.1 protein of unknown function [Clostridium homopropionicum]